MPAAIAGIARQVGVHAEISGKIEGRVHGRLPTDTAPGLLDKLGALYGFDWYFDGQSLYVSAASESAAKVLPLRKIAPADFTDTLDLLGILDRRWPVRFSRNGTLAQIAGPPHYLALIEQTLAAVPEPKADPIADIRVFRGSTAALP